MPRRSYKHIKLPAQLISSERTYVPPPRRAITEKTEFDRTKNKLKLASNVSRIKRWFDRRSGERDLIDDKGNIDIKIAFRGPHDPKLISKYRIDIYKIVPGIKDNEVIYGKISNTKQENQKFSDFERLQNEIGKYNKNERFRTYFDLVRDIKPLDLNEIMNRDLARQMKVSGASFKLDISFGGTKESASSKINLISEEFGDRFISKVNTKNVHYCRVLISFSELENIVHRFGEVSSVEHSPIYQLDTSIMRKGMDTVDVMNPPEGINPAFVFDSDVNSQHLLLAGAVEDVLHNDGSDILHGTAVASLVVCGARVSSSGLVQQDNRVISVKVTANEFSRMEEIIQETIRTYSTRYPLIIANLSINVYLPYYTRKKEVNKLTIFLDDLAKEFGCIFVISAGNLFNGWSDSQVFECRRTGYPDYFKKGYTSIIPPADSINNITVGSIVYQESADSLAKIKSPAIHTRGNIDNFHFVKPDLVHYDSNTKSDYSSEENGVLMAASESHLLTSMPGTSFAAPLVTHDLILLHNQYPELNANSLKALLIHSADSDIGNGILSKRIREKLIGHGLPDVERIIFSTNTKSTIIIEDEIQVGMEKILRFPIPSCLAGSRRRRLRISKTVVFNPLVNGKNPKKYNPIDLFVQLLRDDVEIDSRSTKSIYDGAHMKSNVKKYPTVEKSTLAYTGQFWNLKVACENKDSAFIASDYRQNYSVVITIEDMNQDDSIDVHQDIHNMIEVETHVNVPIQITT